MSAEPRRPALLATLICSIWVGILSLPMLGGKFLSINHSDQYDTGYAFREWAAHQWRTLGEFPQWNPEIFLGMPFVAGMHGDLFYPTAFLRLVVPTHIGMNLGFFVHYILAAMFMYAFLRSLKVGWIGAVTGGIAYQLSGVIGSYVSPGHDGKLFVTAMLPLAALALTWAIRDRRWEGYGVFALAVGLALLSPHPQMAQYFLVATGIYALYLVTNLPTETSTARRGVPLAIALGAVAVGVGIAAVQYLPFAAYIPFSPRHDSVLANDFAFSASYAIPWEHVPEFVLSRFAGERFTGTYWGSNEIKFHSEYLGLAVVVLAGVGFLQKDRRPLNWWLLGIATLFLLVALGASTPFYRLWWSVVPFAESMRAPGMALFCVAFVVAIWAAFGTDRVLSGETDVGKGAVIAGGVVAFLAMAGVVGSLAEGFAGGIQQRTGMPMLQVAATAGDSIRRGALVSGVVLALVGGAIWALRLKRIAPQPAGLLIVALIGTDLWLNARPFWNYSDVTNELFAPDPIKDYLVAQPKPLRVMNPSCCVGVPGGELYSGSALMADNIAQWYGHHGNELHAFDVVNGRQGRATTFTQTGNGVLAAMYGINYVILPTAVVQTDLPGFERVLDSAISSTGIPTTLFRRTDPEPYARVVRSAVKADLEQAAATVIDPRFPMDEVVILDDGAPVDPAPLVDPLPEPWPDLSATVVDWIPGSMRVVLSQPTPDVAYLVVAENHYPDWHAEVDGTPATVMRGNGSLLTVALPAGAREVALRFDSPQFRTGKRLTWLSLLIAVAAVSVPPTLRRRRRV